ncbi:MAG TPA: hypothetical protein VHZ56_13865 [Devosia sp.]|jgi:hypothetical protein|nr:hypothetical protein [Devosia sp.]
MKRKTKQNQELEDSLAEGIASVMAATEALDEAPPDSSEMADLFLEELNRLWAEPPAEQAA